MPRPLSLLSLVSAVAAASARLGSVADFSASPSALVPYPSASASPLPVAYEPSVYEPSPGALMLPDGDPYPSPTPRRPEKDIVCIDDINDPPWNGGAKLPVVPVTINIRERKSEDLSLMRDWVTTVFGRSSFLDRYKLIPRCEAFDPYLLEIDFCDKQLLLRFATLESLGDQAGFSNLTTLACQLYQNDQAQKAERERESGILAGIVLGGIAGGAIALTCLCIALVNIDIQIQKYRARLAAAEEAENRLKPEAYATSAERPDGAYGTARALTVFGRRPGATAPQLPAALFTNTAPDQRPLLSVNGGDARIAPPLNFGDEVDADLLRLAGMSADAAAAAPLIRNAPRGYGTGGAV